MTWMLIAVLAVGTVAAKALGPLTAGGVQPSPPVTRVIEMLTPALITSLVVSGTFGDGQQLVLDARCLGVAGALVALRFRVPLAAALILAAVVTATARAW